MAEVKGDNQLYDDINVTPMLDLAYVLLVVFILMTTASVQGLSMNLPKPSNKPSTEKHELRIIQITPEGRTLINGVAVSLAELESQLKQAKAKDKDVQAMIKGDAKAQYAKVIDVVDLCNRLEVNMGLVTARMGV
jgi:biopolymer transport protein ExbD